MFGFLFVSMLILAVTGCRGTASTAPESETISPSAKLETVQMLLEDLEAPRHPADGGGRAWLDPVPGLYTAGGRGRFSIVYKRNKILRNFKIIGCLSDSFHMVHISNMIFPPSIVFTSHHKNKVVFCLKTLLSSNNITP